MTFIGRLGNFGAGTVAAKLIGRNGVGRPIVATPTLFRDLPKQLGSFRPKLFAVLANWGTLRYTDARRCHSSGAGGLDLERYQSGAQARQVSEAETPDCFANVRFVQRACTPPHDNDESYPADRSSEIGWFLDYLLGHTATPMC